MKEIQKDFFLLMILTLGAYGWYHLFEYAVFGVFHNGITTIYYNMFGEMWLDIILFLSIYFLHFVAIYWCIKKIRKYILKEKVLTLEENKEK